MTDQESITEVVEITEKNFHVGDYVFACRWNDADPNDPWRVGVVEKVVKSDYGTFLAKLRGDAHRYKYARKLSCKEGEDILYNYGDDDVRSKVMDLRNERLSTAAAESSDGSPALRLSTGSCGKKRRIDENFSKTEDELEEIVVNEFKLARLKDSKLRKCGNLLNTLYKCKACVKDAISDVQSVRGFNSVRIYLEDIIDFANRANEIIEQLEKTDPLFIQ